MNEEEIINPADIQFIDYVELPYYPNGIRAGLPSECGDLVEETIAVPSMLAAHANFVLPVMGESMRDFNLQNDDKILVQIKEVPDNGELVVACLRDGLTVKAFYEDEQGRRWLVRGNPDFEPIPLGPDMPVHIEGVVTAILHSSPRVPLRQCAKIVNDYKNVHADSFACDFELLTDQARRKGREEAVVEALRLAAQGSVAGFMEELHHQAMLGYVQYNSLPTTALHEKINKFFGCSFSYESVRRNRRDV